MKWIPLLAYDKTWSIDVAFYLSYPSLDTAFRATGGLKISFQHLKSVYQLLGIRDIADFLTILFNRKRWKGTRLIILFGSAGQSLITHREVNRAVNRIVKRPRRAESGVLWENIMVHTNPIKERIVKHKYSRDFQEFRSGWDEGSSCLTTPQESVITCRASLLTERPKKC